MLRLRAAGYDRLAPRRFQFVPVLGFPTFLVYAMRRVHCPACGVQVEVVPWAGGKHRATDAFAWFLVRWARRLSWQETATIFQVCSDRVFRSVEMAVESGRPRRELEGVRSIGVDRIAWQRCHRYLTHLCHPYLQVPYNQLVAASKFGVWHYIP